MQAPQTAAGQDAVGFSHYGAEPKVQKSQGFIQW